MTEMEKKIEQEFEEWFKSKDVYSGKGFEYQKLTWKVSFIASALPREEKIKELSAMVIEMKEALEFVADNICRHNVRVGVERQWCLSCSSWVYDSDIKGIENMDKCLEKYKDKLEGLK